MSERGTPSLACVACGQEGGHAENCSEISNLEQELSPEFKDRIAPFDADIVIVDNRLFDYIERDSPAYKIGSTIVEAANKVSKKPLEAGLRVHILSPEEVQMTGEQIQIGKNPFPHAKFVFLHTGDRGGFWPRDTVEQNFSERSGWPFIVLGISGASPDNRWKITADWGRDRGVVGNIFRSELQQLIPSMVEELANNPLPPNYTDDDLYKRFQRADSTVHPAAWRPSPEYSPDKMQQRKLVKQKQGSVQPYTRSEYEAWVAVHDQASQKAETRVTAEIEEARRKLEAEREAAIATIPEFQELTPEMQRYVRDLEKRVSTIEAQYPEVDPDTGRSRGNWLELEMLRFIAEQLKDADSVIRKEIAKDNKLAKLFESEKAIDALLLGHYWGYLKYAAPELYLEQNSYQSEFKNGSAKMLLPARWEQEVAVKHPEFRAQCDEVVNEKIRTAIGQLAVSIAHRLMDAERFDKLMEFLQQRLGLTADKVPEIKQAIENEDPEPLTRIMLKLPSGEVSLLSRLTGDAKSLFSDPAKTLNSIMNRFGRDFQHILADDPNLRFSAQGFMRVGIAEGHHPNFRAGFNENHLSFPFISGWKLPQ